MKMILSITPTDNVNYDMGHVIDQKRVQAVTYEWEQNIKVFNTSSNSVKDIQVKELSPYEERIVLDGKIYHILNALNEDKANNIVKTIGDEEKKKAVEPTEEFRKADVKDVTVNEVETVEEPVEEVAEETANTKKYNKKNKR